MIVQYLRDRKNQKRGVVIAVADEKNFLVEYSLVNRKAGDKFVPKVGVGMAEGRAKKSLSRARNIGDVNTVDVSVPDSIFRQIDTFGKRAAKYFKDKRKAYHLVKKSSQMTEEELKKMNRVVGSMDTLPDENTSVTALEKNEKHLGEQSGWFLTVGGETLLLHKNKGNWRVNKV